MKNFTFPLLFPALFRRLSAISARILSFLLGLGAWSLELGAWFLVLGIWILGFVSSASAQAPQLINYQAVARNTSGQLIVNQNISVRISILSGSATGTVEYSETHAVTTNQFGIFNIQIGSGTVVSGIFAQISWGSAPHFVKVEADETGGTNYQLLGTSQLISVPYSMYAEKSGDGFSGNYNDLSNQPALFSGTWGDLTGKPTFATVATSGSYDDLLNKPTLFDGTWTSLTGKPTTLAGYGITDAMSTSHAANGITNTNISNWNTSYGWGNHATAGYLTSFAEQDTMLWKKNGNDLFYNNGNVGIGTTSPNYKLDLRGLPDTTEFGIYPFLSLIATNPITNQDKVGIRFATNNDNALMGTLRFESVGIDESTKFSISTNNAGFAEDRVTILPNGNVGIGTTSPISQLHLRNNTSSSIFTVESNGIGTPQIIFFNDSTIYGLLEGRVNYFGNNIGDNLVLRSNKGGIGFLTKNSNPAMVIDTSGNVGIGITNPSVNLHVKSTNGSHTQVMIEAPNAVSLPYLFLKEYGGNNASANSRILYAANGDLFFRRTLSNGTDGISGNDDNQMVIKSSGNVGIGTTNPNYKLDVAGTLNAQEIRVNGVVLNPGTGSNWSVSGSDIYRLSGNVGIGITNPTSLLHLKSSNTDGVHLTLESADTDGNIWEIISTGSTNTGGAGNLRFYNGTTGVGPIFTSTGNVGIGTTSPNYKLDLRGLSDTTVNGVFPFFSLIATNTIANGDKVGIRFATNNDNAVMGTLRFESVGIDESSKFSISINNAGFAEDRVTILPNGNVGIGTVSPDARLHIYTPSDVDPVLKVVAAGTSDILQLWRGDSLKVVVKENGNVGIGKTNPSAKLHTYSTGNAYNIFESSSTSGALNYLSFAYNGVSKGYVGFGSTDDIFRVTSLFNNDMMFMTNNLERIRILANGNVGIGTANPSAKLEVDNSHIILMSTMDNFALLVDGIDGDGYFGIKNINNQGLIRDNQSNLGDLIIRAENKTIRFTADAGNTAHMSITNSGKIGIGTTAPDPNYKLHIKGSPASVLLEENNPNIRFMKDSTTFWDIGHWSSENNNFKIVYGIGNSKGIHIDTTGNVGIGTTNPLSKLSINGGLHVGGDGDPGDNNLLVDGTISELATRNHFFSGYSFNSGSPMHNKWDMTFGMAYNLNNITGISYLNLPVKTGQAITDVRIPLNVLGTGTVSVTLDLIEQVWNSTAITVIGTGTGTGMGDISISGLPYEVADGKTIYVRINITDATNTIFGLHSLRVSTQAK